MLEAVPEEATDASLCGGLGEDRSCPMHHAVSGCVYAKALNACCPAGPNARNTHVTTALSITIVSCRGVHFLVSYTTLAGFGARWQYR